MGTVILSAMVVSASPTFDGSQIRPDQANEVTPMSGSFFDDATPVAMASNAIRVKKVGDLRLDRFELGRTSDESEVFPPVSGLFSQHLIPPKSAQELEALYSEHSELVVRSFEEVLSPQEKRRFGLVRWKLHQIQSARQGTHLKQLEQRAQEYTDFADQIAQLKADILDKLPKRKHR